MTSASERLSEMVGQLKAQLDLFIVTIKKLEEVINGTAKSGGLKERIAVAEEEIKRNKESWDKVNANIANLRSEILIEVSKISNTANAKAKAKDDFLRELWQGMVKAGAGTVTVAVVGILFWQLILLLAKYAP